MKSEILSNFRNPAIVVDKTEAAINKLFGFGPMDRLPKADTGKELAVLEIINNNFVPKLQNGFRSFDKFVIRVGRGGFYPVYFVYPPELDKRTIIQLNETKGRIKTTNGDIDIAFMMLEGAASQGGEAIDGFYIRGQRIPPGGKWPKTGIINPDGIYCNHSFQTATITGGVVFVGFTGLRNPGNSNVPVEYSGIAVINGVRRGQLNGF